MTIPPRFLDEIRSRITLSEVIGRKMRLTRAGREFKGCCPFHHEKTPSFYVNDDKQFFHCFGCGAHGDVVGFLMRHDNLSFIESVEMLASEAGLQVPQQTPQDIQKSKEEKSLYALLEDTTKFFEKSLRDPANRTALQYLKDRSVPSELLASFRIGFSPSDGQAVRRHLKAQGYTDTQMLEAGVIRKSEKGTEPYAFFRDRVMFPVSDKRGRVVAFGGRILPEHLRPPETGDFKPPKYINSSDTPLFHKGRMLYGMAHARQAAVENQPLIVMEGYLDVMSAFDAGFRGAVAPLGTALTEDQIVALWRMIPSDQKVPVLCFDGDEAGRRAARRAADRVLPLLKPDHSVMCAFLPDGQDPDSLIRAQGAEAFKTVLDSAIPLAEFLWREHTAGRTFDTPEERAGLSKALEQDVLRIPDRDVQYYYRQSFQEQIRRRFAPRPQQNNSRQSFGRRFVPQQPISPLRQPMFSKIRMLEQVLLATLINHPLLFEAVEEQLGSVGFREKGLDRLRQAVLSALGGTPDLDREGLHHHLLQAGFEEEMQLILSESVYTHAGFARAGAGEGAVLEGWRMAHEHLQAISEKQASTVQAAG